jgi:hypothetical protein
MRYFIKVVWLICICATGVSAQVIRKYVEAPRDVILPSIAVQPDCPVKFENVSYFASLEGGGVSSYRIRNIGRKPIRGITVATSYGTKTEYYNNGNVLMMPGKLMPKTKANCPECVKDEIVPLTDELREKLNLKNPMRSIIILMIVEVEFTDGTKYSDEKTYNAMDEFFDQLSSALELQKQQTAKKP